MTLRGSLRALLGWDRVFALFDALILRNIIIHTDRFRALVYAGMIIFRLRLGSAADVGQCVLTIVQFLHLSAKALLCLLQMCGAMCVEAFEVYWLGSLMHMSFEL